MPAQNLVLSGEQQVNLAAFLEGEDNLSLNAVAGSGKTFMIETMIREADRQRKYPASQILYLVFNRRNADEASQRLPGDTSCKTMNGLGHGAWIRARGGDIELDTQKMFKVANIVFQGSRYQKVFPGFLDAMRKSRGEGIIPDDCPRKGRALNHDSIDTWTDLFDHAQIDTGDLDLDEAIDYTRKGLLASIQMAFDGVIDFDDQLYMSVCFGGQFNNYSVVMVDEAQDLSPIQHEMVAASLGRKGRLVMVGDPHQAIYGFRGASAQSFQILAERFKCKELTLSVNFRCGKSIITEAQEDVPHIQAHAGAPDGEVNHMTEWDVTSFKSGDAIICRNVRPLVLTFYRCLRRGVPAKILGSDLGKGLITILEKRIPDSTRKEITEGINRWSRKEWQKATEADLPTKAAMVLEQASVLKVILSECQGERPRPAMIASIKSMFSPKATPITLATIHRSKGGEWDRVWFLDQNLIPSKWAQQEWELQQEYNCRYVARTRARETLNYVQTELITEDV